MRPGLVSVTFRELPPTEVVALAARAGLAGIEWGGDVHVPHGDLTTAAEVRALTFDAGLEVAAYGSYYRVGAEGTGPSFDDVLATAVALDAPTIRVWAGAKGSTLFDAADRAAMVSDTQRIADAAAASGRTVAFEYHANTFTDTSASAVRLLTDVDRPNVRSLWQPPVGATRDECLRGLGDVMQWLANLHVFHWYPTASDRRPLAEGVDDWREYLRFADDGAPRFALLEFVADDDPERLLADAATLRELLAENG